MKQKLGNFRFQHLLDAKKNHEEILSMDPLLIYQCPKSIDTAVLVTIPDASHDGFDSVYGQTEGLYGLSIGYFEATKHIFHPIWMSKKQLRIPYSSFWAEISAVAEDGDRGYDMKMSFNAIFPNVGLPQ